MMFTLALIVGVLVCLVVGALLAPFIGAVLFAISLVVGVFCFGRGIA